MRREDSVPRQAVVSVLEQRGWKLQEVNETWEIWRYKFRTILLSRDEWITRAEASAIVTRLL